MLKEADIGVGVGNIPNSLSKYADIYLEYNGGTSILEFLEKYFYEGGIKMDKYNRNEIAKFYWNSRTIVDEFTEAKEPIYWRSFFETIKYPEV